MALRSAPALGVAMTGPRSRAVGASQWMGKRLADPVPGCEVSRMWDVLLGDMDRYEASRIEKALPPARRRRAFESGSNTRPFDLASVTTLLSGGRPFEMVALCPGGKVRGGAQECGAGA